MREQRLATITALACAALGALLISVRAVARHHARLAPGDQVWRLTYDVRIPQVKAGTRVRVALPFDTAGTRVVRESFIRPHLNMDVIRTKHTGRREAVAVAPTARAELHLVARFDLYVSPTRHGRLKYRAAPLTPQIRSHYLRTEPGAQVAGRAPAETLSLILPQPGTKSELADRIFQYCSETLPPAGGFAPEPPDASARNPASALARARAMVALCRAAGIPARLVTGFVLHNTQDARPHHWVEIHDRARWVPYDPQRGHAGRLPPDCAAVRLDGSEIVRANRSESIQARFSTRRLLPPPWFASPRDGRLIDVVDLTRLPAGMQETLAILLLLPLGALVTALFRNVIGVQTFGTFTPTLLALSFVYADWRTGLAVLSCVALIGLTGRALLNRLRLLMVPRLSLVLTLIVLVLAFAVSVLDYLGLTPSARAVILPLVILTMMIERFHITTEEAGLARSLRLVGGTLVVTACCFALLRWDALGWLLLGFPEGLLFVAAALILVGRYAGYRLTELWRFRDLVRGARP
jgi:hypothetical protein